MKKFLIWLLFIVPMIIVSCGEDKPTKTTAALMVQDILEDKFAADCDFDDMDIRGEESPENYFTVYQPFKSSREGYPRNYVYKAHAIYMGGDKYEHSNWKVKDIIVEDRGTGEQWYF